MTVEKLLSVWRSLNSVTHTFQAGKKVELDKRDYTSSPINQIIDCKRNYRQIMKMALGCSPSTTNIVVVKVHHNY